MGMNDFSLFFPFVRRSVFSRKRDTRSFLPFPLSNHKISFPPFPSPVSPPLPPPLAATVRAPTYATTYTRGFSILHAPPLHCVRTRMSFPEVGKGKVSYSGIIVSLLLSLFPPCMRLAVSAPVDEVAWFLVRFGWHERRERDEEIIPRSPSRSTKGVHPPQNGRREGRGGPSLELVPSFSSFCARIFLRKKFSSSVEKTK